jgi:hypothetical protein
MDNIRYNNYLKEYCKRNKIDDTLISLDAKKAFDSVDHSYIDEVLVAYGFGKIFRNYFKTLYKYITARILINGFASEKIKIERGVKQGDALSCAIFILSIDPLLRNLNSNEKIKPILLPGTTRVTSALHKACGFADDVSILSKNNKESIIEIFREYQRLTDKSGLTLNAEKTEILNLNPESKNMNYNIDYENCKLKIYAINSLKICGIYFSQDSETEPI